MSRFKDWCEKVMPFVVASSNGEVVQASCDNGNTWFDMDECDTSDPALQFDFGDYDYRIKPRTIKIGDFDVPEPMRIPPVGGKEVFSPMPASKDMYWSWPWWGSEADLSAMNRGVVHNNKDSAITHSLAIISLTSAK